MKEIEFVERYQNLISSNLHEIEKARNIILRENKKNIKIAIFGFFLIVFFILLSLFYVEKYDFLIYIQSFLVCTLFLFIISFIDSIKANKKNYTNKLKEVYLPHILSTFGNIKKISNTFASKTLKDSKLFPRIHTIYSEDSFIGSHNDTVFLISEVLIRNYGCDFHRYLKEVLFKFSSKKKIDGNLIIYKKYYRAHFAILFVIFFISLVTYIPFLYKHAWDFADSEIIIVSFLFMFLIAYTLLKYNKTHLINFKKIEINNKEFMKKYKIYSNCEINANEIITPTFINRLVKLEKIFEGKNIKFSLSENNVMIAIESKKDLFEIANINTPFDSPKFAIEFYNQISSIYDMIDYFNENRNTER